MDPSLDDIEIGTIKTRSVSGVVTLISRSFFLQIVSLVGFFLLTVFLGRADVGLFIAVNDLVSILGYFSDIGLAASLIQKKTQLTLVDVRTTFTLQQLLVVTSITLMLLFSQPLFSFYNIDSSGTWLFYSLLFGFFAASLKTIPSVLLERKLRFEVLALVEVLENLVFYVVAVFMAWQGRGVMAYAWAVALRAIIGTTLLYILSPWKIGFSLSRSSIKSLLSFGLPYQINSLMAVVKDRFLNIALWKIIGADGVGIIGWAQTWSQKPLRFVLDNVSKVTFPAYSRLQEDKKRLQSALEKSLQFVALTTFPTVAGIAVTAPIIVQIFPQYTKWEVALLPLAFYCLGSVFASISTTITNTFNAIGKVKINTYLMIMWTLLTWILTPALALKFGYLGVAYATGIIAFSSLVPLVIIRRYIPVRFIHTVGSPALATLVMLVVSLTLRFILPPNFFTLTLNIILSALTFLGTSYLLLGAQLVADIKQLAYAFRKK